MNTDSNELNTDEKLIENSELVCENNNSSKKVIKNIIFVAISNFIKLLSGILVGFAIPKIMGETNYGFYKTFTLYLSYVGLLHFGFCDGIYLLYGGKKVEDLNPEIFRTYSKFYLIFQLIISVLIIIPSTAMINNDYGFIFLFIGFNIIFTNITTYYQFISQITGRFKELSIINIIQAILTSVIVIVLTILFYLNVLSIIEYKIYIVLSTFINVILAIWYIVTYRGITFGKSLPLKKLKTDIFKIFKVGFILLIANLVSNLILIMDRQFVNILVNMDLYTMADYGVYSFAYNMLSLITTIISAISVVLYPTIKVYSKEKLKNDYNSLISIIAIITSFCMIAYFPLCFIVNTWLPKYVNSLIIFRVILPGLVISSCVTMIMYNYYKAMNKHFLFFLISIIILVLSIIANILAYVITKQLVWISTVSVIVIAIWYIMSEMFIVKEFKIKTLKNIIYICLIIFSYLFITFLIENIYFGFALYLISYIIITLVFNYKLIFKIIRRA